MDLLNSDVFLLILKELEANHIFRILAVTTRLLRTAYLEHKDTCLKILENNQISFPVASGIIHPSAVFPETASESPMDLLRTRYIPSHWRTETWSPSGFYYQGSNFRVTSGGTIEYKDSWGDPHGNAGLYAAVKVPVEFRAREHFGPHVFFFWFLTMRHFS